MFLIRIIIVNDSGALMTDFNVYVTGMDQVKRDLWDFLRREKGVD